MGNETILYYVTEEFITNQKKSMNIHFWQKVSLSSFVLEKDGITIVMIVVPDLKKGWKAEKLLRLMKEAASEYLMLHENAHVLIQPPLQKICMQSDDLFFALPVLWILEEKILSKVFSGMLSRICPESVVLLLGNTLFPEEQMQKFMDMMTPYFPRVNHLTILYTADDMGETDIGQRRYEETISEYTEEIYYEYGLVTQLRQGSNSLLKRHSVRTGQSAALFLDYGYPGNSPLRALKSGDIYLDVFSTEEKEALFRRKYMEISYFSPRKYLDTMVKSGYDKLVNQAICQKVT